VVGAREGARQHVWNTCSIEGADYAPKNFLRIHRRAGGSGVGPKA
jgi:hypothetical protein